MNTYTILVMGRGKLAKELLDGLNSPAVSRVLAWEMRDREGSDPCMVIHAGSGRELPAAIDFCTRTGAVLFELATGESTLPDAPGFPAVLCPNVNLEMLGFMAMVKGAAKHFQGLDIRITESHQASRTTKPGTAVFLAEALGVPETEIRSERDPHVQEKTLGIPPSFLDRHAYHEILIQAGETQIRMEAQVLGKSAYAKGLLEIISRIHWENLAPGQYHIVNLLMDQND